MKCTWFFVLHSCFLYFYAFASSCNMSRTRMQFDRENKIEFLSLIARNTRVQNMHVFVFKLIPFHPIQFLFLCFSLGSVELHGFVDFCNEKSKEHPQECYKKYLNDSKSCSRALLLPFCENAVQILYDGCVASDPIGTNPS